MSRLLFRHEDLDGRLCDTCERALTDADLAGRCEACHRRRVDAERRAAEDICASAPNPVRNPGRR